MSCVHVSMQCSKFETTLCEKGLKWMIAFFEMQCQLNDKK